MLVWHFPDDGERIFNAENSLGGPQAPSMQRGWGLSWGWDRMNIPTHKVEAHFQ